MGGRTSKTSHPPRLTPRTGSVPYEKDGLNPNARRARTESKESAVAQRHVENMMMPAVRPSRVEGGTKETVGSEHGGQSYTHCAVCEPTAVSRTAGPDIYCCSWT